MSMSQTLSVSLKDNVNQSSTMSYAHERSFLEALANFFGFTTSKADDLKDFAETYSNAKVVSCGTTNKNIYAMPDGFLNIGVIDEGFDTVDQKAVLSFRDSGTGARHQITVPAPKSSMFEKILGQGYRVTAATGSAMATTLSTIVGNTLIFEEGWLIGKK